MAGADAKPASPRVFTIAPGAPFLKTLACAVLAGDLPVPGGEAPDPLDLPRWTILLPTRRAVRAMREAFLAASEGTAMLLPAIRPIGDVDEDAALLAPPPEPDAGAREALEVPDAIGGLERRLVLTRLVLAWSEAMRAGGVAAGGPLSPVTVPPALTPGQASHWAADLAALMDSAETEGVDLARVGALVGGDYAEHWQRTIDFLAIVTEHWPQHLSERSLLSPYARRDRLMRAETERLAASPPPAPVIAAGSTGTVPATAALLETIARLPLGAVVLPGLDTLLDEPSWRAIDGERPHPEHPQFGMKQLLDRLGLPRGDVRQPGTAPPHENGRARLVSEVMRPAGTTQKWRGYVGEAGAQGVAAAVRGITRIDAPTGQEEAEAISLVLRQALEEPGRTAALVTPDRVLARRVAARLEKWGLSVDDSAGRPLARTPPGVFMDLLLAAVESGFGAVALMALLKHPLARLGRTPEKIGSAARALELAGLRRPFAGAGLETVRTQLRLAREELRGDGHAGRPLRRMEASGLDEALSLLKDLEAAVAPFAALHGDGVARPVHALARAHVAAGEALARDETGGSDRLWSGDDGEALALLFAELLTSGDHGPSVGAEHYPDLYRSLLAGLVVRERQSAHPRLFIWGPLEARLQRADTVVLGGLNEETWPAVPEAGPWLSRPMLETLGLASPERRIGLAAHDVAQLMGAPRLFLTRAEKIDGAPTVPSRWLLRLEAILEAAGVALEKGDWLAWAANRDHAAPAPPIAPPAPRPPAEARPRRLSVTAIERWIANPYAVFAQYILGLSPLDPLAAEPDARARGEVVHAGLSAFAKAHPDRLPQRIADELMRLVRRELERFGAHPRVRAFWEPQLHRFALWFAATEPERRAGVARVLTEVAGELPLAGADFTLTARADRIDLLAGGGLAIYDYKTGQAPSRRQVEDAKAPQLPLEAAIAARGGFEAVEGAPVAALRYIRVIGREPAGEDRAAASGDPQALAETALAELAALVAAYADPSQPYEALRRPAFAGSPQYRYDDYAHLARVAEWLAASAGEEPGP